MDIINNGVLLGISGKPKDVATFIDAGITVSSLINSLVEI